MGAFSLGKMTIGSLFRKPETIQYPIQHKPAPAGLKGHIVNHVDSCIACGMCAKVCPAGALSVSKKPRTWSIDRFRCVQCGSCVRACPKSCLEMDPVYTSPSVNKYVDTCEVPEKDKVEAAAAQ